MLEEERAERGVIHCFTGGHELARRALALGFYISFSGILAFPKSESYRKSRGPCPSTACSWKRTPRSWPRRPIAGKRNEPAFVVEVARKVAALRGIPVEEVGQAAAANFRRLFGLG